MRKKRLTACLAVLMGVLLLSGCDTKLSTTVVKTTEDTEATEEKTDISTIGTEVKSGTVEDEGISIALSDDASTCDGDGVTIEDNVVTITQAGTYILSGKLSDGHIAVETDKDADVELVLNGVDITCSDYAAIVVLQAGNVDIKLAKGSVNKVEDGKEYTYIDSDDNTDGCIFSKDDLDFKGSGTLYVTANYKHGIVCKDDLEFKKGTYVITAVEDGVNANDSITVESGNFFIAAGDDGMHSDEIFTVEDGEITVTESEEGLEGHQVIINGGAIDITASDDGINTNCGDNDTDETAEGDSSEVKPDLQGEANGDFDPSQMGDFQGQTPPEMPDGENTAFDPTQNGGFPGKGQMQFDGQEMQEEMQNGERPEGMQEGGMPGGGMGQTDENSLLQINGGSITINASGDGLDSNGYLEVNGGTVFVSGATNNGNGALDPGLGIKITGGTVIAAGYSGMAENFGSDSTQISYRFNSNTVYKGTDTITVTDSEGNEILSWIPGKEYNSVVVSTPEFKDGETYYIQLGSDKSELS